MVDTMALTLPRLSRDSNGLSSMIEEVEVVVKKMRYVGFVADNNAVCLQI